MDVDNKRRKTKVDPQADNCPNAQPAAVVKQQPEERAVYEQQLRDVSYWRTYHKINHWYYFGEPPIGKPL